MILVVDDHIGLAHGLQRLLQQAGFEAAYVTSGQDALEFVAKRKPELVILDQNMPFMSGLETLQSLKRLPGANDIRVVIASAAEDRNIEAKALDLGAVGCLVKGGTEWDNVESMVRRYLPVSNKTSH